MDTRTASAAARQRDPDAILASSGRPSSSCPHCRAAAGVTSRRRLFGAATKAAVALTALAGGFVRFSPTAVAQAGCIPGTVQNIPYFQCAIGCVGFCSPSFSVCTWYWSGGQADCVATCAQQNCGTFRASVTCLSGGNGYCCARYC